MQLFCRSTFMVAALLIPYAALGQDKDPNALLEEAMRFADLYNWADAAPLFTEAEQSFLDRGDASKALLAKLGRIRSTMGQLSLPETSVTLEAEL